MKLKLRLRHPVEAHIAAAFDEAGDGDGARRLRQLMQLGLTAEALEASGAVNLYGVLPETGNWRGRTLNVALPVEKGPGEHPAKRAKEFILKGLQRELALKHQQTMVQAGSIARTRAGDCRLGIYHADAARCFVLWGIVTHNRLNDFGPRKSPCNNCFA